MSHNSSSDQESDDGFYGPSLPPLPPAKSQSTSGQMIGPVLPPGIIPAAGDGSGDSSDEDVGPHLPDDISRQHPEHLTRTIVSEAKAGPSREEWMTVIPEKVEKRLGFQSVTSFSKRPVGPVPPAATPQLNPEPETSAVSISSPLCEN